MGCLLRLVVSGVFLLVVVALCLGSYLLFQYNRIKRELPDVGSLRQNASQFETTRILDRNGNVLYEILDPNAGRRTYVPIERISPYMLAATIATEDKDFYSHPGFDVIAIARAFWQNYQTGDRFHPITAAGAQPALRAEARKPYSGRSAPSYVIPAGTKDDLELYLNENTVIWPRGGGGRGTYFGVRRHAVPGAGVLPGRAPTGSLCLRCLHKP
jgi:hypothetical protein